MHNPAYESTPWLGRTCHRKSLLRKKVTLKVREASDPTQCTTGFEVDVLNVICRKAPSIQDVVLTPTGPRMLSIVTKHPKSRPSTTSCRNMIQFQDKQPTIVASATTRCSWWRCKWQLESRANQPLKPTVSTSRSKELFLDSMRTAGRPAFPSSTVVLSTPM